MYALFPFRSSLKCIFKAIKGGVAHSIFVLNCFLCCKIKVESPKLNASPEENYFLPATFVRHQQNFNALPNFNVLLSLNYYCGEVSFEMCKLCLEKKKIQFRNNYFYVF